MFSAAVLGVIGIGLLHGLEPGHGWPVAVLYSIQKKNSVRSAALSSGIIGLAHLVSSVAVVVAYVLLQSWLDFEADWIKYVGAGLLLVLAVRMWLEKTDAMEKQHGHIHPEHPNIEHDHSHVHPGGDNHTHAHSHKTGMVLSLLGIAAFALVLGFAHEEEFALLALVASGANAWVLMLSYGVAVLLGLMAVTILGVKMFKRIHHRLLRVERYIPKLGAILLVVMAVIIVWA